MPSLKTCNIMVALTTCLVGAMIAYVSYGYGIAMSEFGPEPGFWPFLLGSALIFISALIVLDTLRHKEQLQTIKIVFTAAANISSYKIMFLVIAYILLLQVLGFYVDTLIFMSLCMFMLGVNNKLLLTGVSFAFLGFIYLIFSLSLGITLPLPFFMEQ